MTVADAYKFWSKDPAGFDKNKNYRNLYFMFLIISIFFKISSGMTAGVGIHAMRQLDIIISSANIFFLIAIFWCLISQQRRLSLQVSGDFLELLSESNDIPEDVKKMIAKRISLANNKITYRQIFSIDKNYVSDNAGTTKIKQWDDENTH